MTILNVVGWELRSILERLGSVGSAGQSYDTTDPRTGSACFRHNLAAGQTSAEFFGGLGPAGANVALGRSAATYITFHFKVAAIPSGSQRIALVSSTANAYVCWMVLLSTGDLHITSAIDLSASSGVVTANTWQRVDMVVTQNAACYASLNGGAPVSCTGSNFLIDRVHMGTTLAAPAGGTDTRYDDLIISDAALTEEEKDGGAKLLLPVGAGITAQWTNGTSTLFSACNEVPHNGDTSYIAASATQDGTNHFFDMTPIADVGIAAGDSITAVKTCIVVREGTAGVGPMMPALYYNGGIHIPGTEYDVGTTYAQVAMINETNPYNAAPWTGAAIDAMECGVYAGAVIAVQLRCTQVAAYVWVPAAPPEILADVPLANESTEYFGQPVHTAKRLEIGPAAVEQSTGVFVVIKIQKRAGMEAGGVRVGGVALVEVSKIFADVASGPADVLGILPTSRKSAPVEAGPVEVFGLAPGSHKSAGVGLGLADVVGNFPATRKAAPAGIGLADVLGLAPAAKHLAGAGVGLVDVAGLVPTAKHLAGVNPGPVDVLGLTFEAAAGEAVVAAGPVEVVGLAPSARKLAAAGVGPSEQAAPGVAVARTVTAQPGPVEVAAAPPAVRKLAAAGVGAVELVGINLASTAAAEVGRGGVEVVGLAAGTSAAVTLPAAGEVNLAAVPLGTLKFAELQPGHVVVIAGPFVEPGLLPSHFHTLVGANDRAFVLAQSSANFLVLAGACDCWPVFQTNPVHIVTGASDQPGHIIEAN